MTKPKRCRSIYCDLEITDDQTLCIACRPVPGRLNVAYIRDLNPGASRPGWCAHPHPQECDCGELHLALLPRQETS